MKYSQQEIIQYVQEEDVKFIRLAFCDIFGKQKNISIMPDELPKAFTYGIAIDASAIDGFGDETHSDLFLHPEPDTLMPLPWRPAGATGDAQDHASSSASTMWKAAAFFSRFCTAKATPPPTGHRA